MHASKPCYVATIHLFVSRNVCVASYVFYIHNRTEHLGSRPRAPRDARRPTGSLLFSLNRRPGAGGRPWWRCAGANMRLRRRMGLSIRCSPNGASPSRCGLDSRRRFARDVLRWGSSSCGAGPRIAVPPARCRSRPWAQPARCPGASARFYVSLTADESSRGLFTERFRAGSDISCMHDIC